MSKREKETYLGDAVYASFDGCWIKLRTENEVLFINAVVFNELEVFAKKCWELRK